MMKWRGESITASNKFKNIYIYLTSGERETDLLVVKRVLYNALSPSF